MELKCNFRGEEISLKATANDKSWGKGLDIDFQFKGIDCKVGFICHPEFDNCDECNSLPHKKLFERAVSILSSGDNNKEILEASNQGLRLFLVLNAANVT